MNNRKLRINYKHWSRIKLNKSEIHINLKLCNIKQTYKQYNFGQKITMDKVLLSFI